MYGVRRFLELASYFRKTRKGVVFEWTVHQEDFEVLKAKFIDRSVLTIYNRDAESEVHCDASKIGFGDMLLQKQWDEDLEPVQYYNRAIIKEEQNYYSYELETLVLVESLKKFWIYLLGT